MRALRINYPSHNHDAPVAIDVMLSSDMSGEVLPDYASHDDYDASDDAPGVSAASNDDHDLDSFEDDELPEPAAAPRRRARGAQVQVRELAEGEVVSVYQRLIDYGLLKKVTDIVMAKVSVPWHLREDATQEVHAAWAALTAKPNFARNQLARYAYMSGQHAALKLRRNIGAVVAIPGALFRTGRDTAFMEAIGAAVNPKDVDDYKDSLELSVEPEEYSNMPQRVSADFMKARLEGLTLSKSQRAVAERVLVRRMSIESIAQELNVRVSYVERLVAQVTGMLYARDDAALGRPAGKKSGK